MFFNPFFINLLLNIPDFALTVVSVVLALIFTADVIVSFIIISKVKLVPSGDTITSYGYSIDGGANWVTSNNNSYTFSNLEANTTYKIKVKVNSTKANTVDVTAKTKDVQLPNFTKTNNTVTITYPSGCGSTYTCQYKKSTDTNFTTANNSTVNIEFNEAGTYTLIATITDGVTTVTRSYTFTIS